MKTSELTGGALDLAVAKCEFEGCEDWDGTIDGIDAVSDMQGGVYSPSTNWAQGGQIIEREQLSLDFAYRMEWEARMYVPDEEPLVFTGPTPLTAAMRCYVASKLGYEVEVPEGLK